MVTQSTTHSEQQRHSQQSAKMLKCHSWLKLATTAATVLKQIFIVTVSSLNCHAPHYTSLQYISIGPFFFPPIHYLTLSDPFVDKHRKRVLYHFEQNSSSLVSDWIHERTLCTYRLITRATISQTRITSTQAKLLLFLYVLLHPEM